MPWPDFCPVISDLAGIENQYQKDNCKTCGVIIGIPLWLTDVDYSDTPHFECLECFVNHRRCVEHGNIDCRLECSSQFDYNGRVEPITTCGRCDRPFHPNVRADVAHRHYCEMCLINGTRERYNSDFALATIQLLEAIREV
jgi:hypothetical protein